MEVLNHGSSLVLGSTLAVLGGAYIDAKLGISKDLRTLYYERTFSKRLQERIKELSPITTHYGMLQHAVDVRGLGAAEALWFEQKTWTYAQLKDLADHFAALLYSKGIRTGDFVALFTTNSPEMVVSIYALAKLGVVAALINTNLRDETFQHCINVSKAKTIISTPDLAPFVKGDLTHYSLNLSSFNGIKPVSQATDQSVTLITEATIRQVSSSLVSPAQRSIFDIAVLIYTSGTTGKPKACAIRNLLLMITSNPLTIDVENASFPLRIYSALPLFHGTCLFAGFSYAVGTGSTFCIRRRFSASQFWKDVHDSGATSVLYIGELCRYLLASPPSPYDRNHKCVLAYGNGLRGEIWDKFRTRFGVKEIREVYRSTEGIAKYDNFTAGAWGHGCVGFVGALRQFLEDDVFIVRYDPETEAPWRDPKTGFCVKAKVGEEGEVIGRVRNRDALTEYLGDNGATEKKLLRDVFAKGDLFQRMGDLLMRDADGWIRFQDRVGDTFRWKGENVSAGEVRNHICKIDNVQDAVVYGVKLKSYDGQAGGAAITLEKWTPDTEKIFIQSLYKELVSKGIPSYAIPRFVRIIKAVNTGVTFKQAKNEQAAKGWDPRQDWGGDHLYWLNSSPSSASDSSHKKDKKGNWRYEKLDESNWEQIERGQVKL